MMLGYITCRYNIIQTKAATSYMFSRFCEYKGSMKQNYRLFIYSGIIYMCTQHAYLNVLHDAHSRVVPTLHRVSGSQDRRAIVRGRKEG